jgi:D-alanyl-D-alanine carboxypeptidase/D-alanyl-D-alanine-endopeptidase (penicillin-binding protein 4)
LFNSDILFAPVSQQTIKKIQAIVQKVDHYIGVEIYSTKTNTCIFARNANKLFIPASNMKLFACLTALEKLGADYQFETILATDGDIQDNKLCGNVYIVGSGDPSVTSADIEDLVKGLVDTHIKTIAGDFCIDTEEFDREAFAPGTMIDYFGQSWSNPVGGLIVDHKAAIVHPQNNVEFVDNAKLQNIYFDIALFIEQLLKKYGITLSGKIILKKIPIGAQGAHSTENSCMGSHSTAMRVEKGSLKEKRSHSLKKISVNKDSLSQGSVNKVFLKQSSLNQNSLDKEPLGENFSTDKFGANTIMQSHQSQKLCVLLSTMMKSSDNLYADCLLKKIGASTTGVPASFATGIAAVQEFLQKSVGIETKKMRMVDGSGLSRYNLVSPHQIVALLVWAYKNHDFDCFLQTLPVSGLDGTLAKRMVDIQERVRAKTGTMGGVSALSGYIDTDDDVLIFSIINNCYISESVYQPPCKSEVEDAICRLLCADNCA